MENLKNIVKGKIDVKWIIIVILVLIVLGGVFKFNSIPKVDTSKLDNKVDSLEVLLSVLQAAAQHEHDSIINNDLRIDTIYIDKTKDSIRIVGMTTGELVEYFKNYVDTYNPVKLKPDTIAINASYIQGANTLFLDRDAKVEQVTLLEDNISHFETIEAKCIEQINIVTQLGDTKLEIKQSEVDRLNNKVKKQRKELLKWKLGSIVGVGVIILVLI